MSVLITGGAGFIGCNIVSELLREGRAVIICGAPIVSTNIGGISEIVQHGITGELAKERNPQQVANKLKLVLKNKGKYCKNCIRMSEKYSNVVLSKKIVQELKSVCHHKRK